MNTLIWGPPTWRFLHGTSFLGEESADALETIVRSLAHVMPCSHCRASYAVFAAELGIDRIGSIIRSNKYALWMYNLHNRVAAKLLRTKMEVLALSPAQQDEMVAVTTLPYSALKQRLMMSACTPYFSTNDVLLMLGTFAYAAKETDDHDRKTHYLNFANAVGTVLATMRVEPYATLGERIQTHFADVTPSNFATAAFEALLAVEGTSATVKDYCSVLALARAQTCANGTCK